MGNSVPIRIFPPSASQADPNASATPAPMATQAQPTMTAAEQSESIAYLRERGVEVDLPEERAAGERAQATIPGGPPFSFVHIPADSNAPVVSLETAPAEGDVLKSLLAPCFASNEVLDPEVVMRETSARVKNMVMSGGLGDVRAPSASAIAKEAEGGACEAYQLAPATESNGWRAVRLYIDEVGALRNPNPNPEPDPDPDPDPNPNPDPDPNPNRSARSGAAHATGGPRT